MSNDSSDASSGGASLTRLRQILTFGALVLALVHTLVTALRIDAITLVLLLVAVIPWLAPLFKSVEFPGGWKITFTELEKAAQKADNAGLLAPAPRPPTDSLPFPLVAERDPNLALAGLRIEIERRLNKIASAHGITSDRPAGVGQLLRQLSQRGMLSSNERSVLSDLTNLLNSAVHGATVDPKATGWAMEIGPRLLATLDDLAATEGITS